MINSTIFIYDRILFYLVTILFPPTERMIFILSSKIATEFLHSLKIEELNIDQFIFYMNISQTLKLVGKLHTQRKQIQPVSFQSIDKVISFSDSLRRKHHSFIETLAPRAFLVKVTCLFLILSVALLVVSIFNTAFTVLLPFINKHLLMEIKALQQRTFINVFTIVIQVLGIKLLRILLLMTGDLLQQYVGCIYYSYMQANIVKCLKQNNSQLSGNKINLLEDDSERVINMPYCILSVFQNPIEIISLTGIMIGILPPRLAYLVVPIFIVVTIQLINGYASYRINGELMKSKDQRVQCILRGQSLMKTRIKQINNIKNYMMINLLAKVIGQVGYAVLYLLIFWLSDEEMDTEDKYSLLMILTLLKTPIQSLSSVGVTFMSNFNSLKRIQNGTDQIRFIREDQHPNQHKLNQSVEYKNFNEEIAQARNQEVQSLPATSKQLITGSFQTVPNQKGEVVVGAIIKCIRMCISPVTLIMAIFFFVGVICVNVWAYTASQNVISSKFDLKYQIPLVMQIIFMVLSFVIVAYMTLALSRFISKSMEQKSSYQILNRFSGDIRALDISLCFNTYEFFFLLCLIFASFIYNAISFQNWAIAIIFIVFIILLMFATFKIHRYMMWARRQVLRQNCRLKTKLIGSINSLQNFEYSFEILIKIFKTKVLGFFIQVLGSGIIMSMSTIVSIVSISVCLAIQIPEATMAILLFALLNIDFDLQYTFIRGIMLQLSLISVERTLNAVDIKSSHQQQNS